MARYWIDLLDKYGVRQRTINGQPASGPARGVTDLTFHARGTRRSQSGQASFKLPLTLVRNNAVQPGMMVAVHSSANGLEGTYLVPERQAAIAADGHWGTYVCPDLLAELTLQLVAGIAAGPTESLPSLAQRIVAEQLETAWTAHVTLAGYEGVGFAADSISVQQTIGQLCAERFCGYRLGEGRTLEIGRFGEISGIRLTKPSRRPYAMRNPNIRAIIDLKPVEDLAGVVNCIIGTGAGNGFGALTLESLFTTVGSQPVPGTNWTVSGPVSFAGQDVNYPVFRRPRRDAGYQYFLADLGAIAADRQRWLPYPRTEIAPVSAAPADVAAAVAALYQKTLAYLKGHARVNHVFSVTSHHTGDNRGVAGKWIWVSFHKSVEGVDTIAINGLYQVEDVETAVDTATGRAVDTWLLSSEGRRPANDGMLVTGILEDIDYLKSMPQIYPARQPLAYGPDYLDAGHPIEFPIFGDAAILARVAATLVVNLIPIRSTATGAASVGHAHDVLIPGLNVPIPALAVSIPAQSVAIPALAIPIQALGVPVSGGAHNTAHNPGAHTNSLPTASGALIVATTAFVDLKSPASGGSGIIFGTVSGQTVVTDVQARTTASHTHSFVVGAATGAASYSVAPTNGTYAGFAIGASTSATSTTSPATATTTAATATTTAATATTSTATIQTVTGGVHSHDMVYGIFTGPLPTGVQVFVDGAEVTAGPQNPAGGPVVTRLTLDILSKINDQRDHTVRITAQTMGGIVAFLNERHRETTARAS